MLIVRPILQEVLEKPEQPLAIIQQDLLHSDRFVRIGHEDLEHVKPFVLNHLSLITKQVHADLQVLASVDICGHHRVVRAVKKDLPEQLDRLALRHIAVRFDEDVVVLIEKQIKVLGEVLGNNSLMPGQ